MAGAGAGWQGVHRIPLRAGRASPRPVALSLIEREKPGVEDAHAGAAADA